MANDRDPIIPNSTIIGLIFMGCMGILAILTYLYKFVLLPSYLYLKANWPSISKNAKQKYDVVAKAAKTGYGFAKEQALEIKAKYDDYNKKQENASSSGQE